jgi:hypothetical protein
LFAGHDYLDGDIGDSGYFGVKSAVNEFAALVGARVMRCDEDWPSWYWRKTAAMQL